VATQDLCVTIHPYFKVSEGNLGAFRELCEQFVSKTIQEPRCLYYGFSFRGDEVYCREGYEDAVALLAHLENVGALLGEALKLAEVARLEIHGTEEELDQLRGPLAEFNPTYFVLEYGFRR
jgi:quinol monooxygenase YgiN